MSVLVDSIRRLGAVDGGLYLLSRAIDRTTANRCRLIKYLFLAQPVSDTPLVDRRKNDTLQVLRVDLMHPLADTFPRPSEVIAARYAQGALCFAAVRNGDLVGFLWLVHNRYEEDEVRSLFVPLPTEQAVWDFDVYLDPRYRLGRGFARLWEAAYEYLRERRIRWTISRVSAFNADSIRVHTRLGARRLGWAVFLTLGTAQFTMTDRPPYLHLSLSRRRRPVLALHVPK